MIVSSKIKSSSRNLGQIRQWFIIYWLAAIFTRHCFNHTCFASNKGKIFYFSSILCNRMFSHFYGVSLGERNVLPLLLFSKLRGLFIVTLPFLFCDVESLSTSCSLNFECKLNHHSSCSNLVSSGSRNLFLHSCKLPREK